MYDPSAFTVTDPCAGSELPVTVRDPASLASRPELAGTVTGTSTVVATESSAAVGVTVIVTVRVSAVVPSVAV